MKELTMEQAREIAIASVGPMWEHMPAMTQTQAVMGAMVMVQAMIAMGYKINPPLKSV